MTWALQRELARAVVEGADGVETEYGIRPREVHIHPLFAARFGLGPRTRFYAEGVEVVQNEDAPKGGLRFVLPSTVIPITVTQAV